MDNKNSYKKSVKSKLNFVIQYFPPDFAATGQLLNDLTKRLVKLNYKINITTSNSSYANKNCVYLKKEYESSRTIQRVKISNLWDKKLIGRLINGLIFCAKAFGENINFAKKKEIIFYTSEPAFLPIMGWLLNLIYKHPYVVIFYDIYPDVLVNLNILSSTNIITKAWRKINQLVIKDSKAIIVLSEPMAKKIRGDFNNEKINIIPSWADGDAIKPLRKSNNKFCKELSIEDKFVVLYSGNQGRCHDLLTIVNCAYHLKNDYQTVFLFIGNGAQNNYLRNMANQYNLKNIIFKDYQPFKDLNYSLNSADLAVVSLGKNTEGLIAPSKLYGHLAAGSPIAAIAPKESYLSELVNSYNCGKWIDNEDYKSLANFIRELKVDIDLKNMYKKNSRKLFEENFSADKIAKKYEKILKEIYK